MTSALFTPGSSNAGESLPAPTRLWRARCELSALASGRWRVASGVLVPCADGPNRSPLPLRGAFGRGCSRCALVTISSPGDTALAKASWPSLAEIIQSSTPRSVVRSSDPQILFDYKILEGAES